MNQSFHHFADWMSRGPLAAHVTEQHHLAGLSLTAVDQPAGDMSDPPLPELIFGLSVGPAYRAHADFGDGWISSEIRPGDHFYVPPRSGPRIICDGPQELLVVAIAETKVRMRLREHNLGLQHLRPPSQVAADPAVRVLLRRLRAELQSPSPATRLVADCAVSALLAALTVPSRQPVERPKRGGLAPAALRRVRELCSERFAEEISLDDLASEAQLSSWHFCRAFKVSMGVSPHAHVMNLRMARARELLETTGLSITEVSLAVGYQSTQAFARAFRRAHGASPSAWRVGPT